MPITVFNDGTSFLASVVNHGMYLLGIYLLSIYLLGILVAEASTENRTDDENNGLVIVSQTNPDSGTS